jgi:endonuclease/exonuclease/phosphatase family metal-dependent hydrolase
MGDFNAQVRLSHETTEETGFLDPLWDIGMTHVLNPERDLTFNYPDTRITPPGDYKPGGLAIDHMFVIGHKRIVSASSPWDEVKDVSDHGPVQARIVF